ncbi:hypothetical protein MUP77_22290, partial [Candidatus Bathyarchaeota archaeon]|nr:hypothetical protein [Candidatus Bathyarchaeota archaeon]
EKHGLFKVRTLDWITRDLAIGNFEEAMHEPFFTSHQIDTLITLCSSIGVESLPIRDITTVEHLRIPISIDLLLHDNVPLFKQKIQIASEIIQFILTKNKTAKAPKKIMMHCHYGMDGAPAVVALALHDTYPQSRASHGQTRTIVDSYEYVKNRRPQTRIHWGWVTDTWNEEDREYSEKLKRHYNNLLLERIRSTRA